MFDLVNIFDVFLPQLLLYPNPKDPLNGEAATRFNHDEARYKETVREYVKKYASQGYIESSCKVVNKEEETKKE